MRICTVMQAAAFHARQPTNYDRKLGVDALRLTCEDSAAQCDWMERGVCMPFGKGLQQTNTYQAE
eukprot:361692-Chlamydomonas_euryale.AAC.2